MATSSLRADKRAWALAGAALLNPVAAMFWLELRRGHRPDLGLVAISAAGGLCAALAARPSPRQAAAAGLVAVAGGALAGVALDAWVTVLERLGD